MTVNYYSIMLPTTMAINKEYVIGGFYFSIEEHLATIFDIIM